MAGSESEGSAPPETLELLRQDARRLRELYVSQRRKSTFKRTLEECLLNERQKITGQLFPAYLPHLVAADVKFLSGRYFGEHDGFHRFQDIPEKYFTRNYESYYFVSHRWRSAEHPDPDGAQFTQIKALLGTLKPEIRDTWGFWYDYSCIPQRSGSGQRSGADERVFQAQLKLMHLLPMLSSNITLFDSGYLDRAWCMMEWICATKISPLPVAEEPVVPLFNHVKFRHLALLVLFLTKDDAFRRGFMTGDEDQAVIGHLNSLVFRSLENCASTIASDKNLLIALLYEHFQYHLMLLGFRTQLMTAFLLLDRFDEDMIELLFLQFLAISQDPAMNWTKATTFVLEGLLNNAVTPTELIFHRQEIKKKSNSSLS